MDDIEMAVADALIKAQEKEITTLKLQLSEVMAHRDRLRDMLNEIRGRANRDVFSSEPSNFAALVLKIVEDGYTEKRNCDHKRFLEVRNGEGRTKNCADCGMVLS